MYNIPKQLGDSDVRCVVLDNHRPTHLANIHSDYKVVILDNEDYINSEREFIPTYGSDLSGADDTSNDEDDGDSDDDEFDDDDDDDVDDDDEQVIKITNNDISKCIFYSFYNTCSRG